MSCTYKIAKLWPHVGTCVGSSIKLPYTGLPEGMYKVMLRFLNSEIVMNITAVDGTLTLPTKELNENYYYEGTVHDASGSALVFNTDYSAFSFKTTFIKIINS